jgi:hypothetical protein
VGDGLLGKAYRYCAKGAFIAYMAWRPSAFIDETLGFAMAHNALVSVAKLRRDNDFSIA